MHFRKPYDTFRYNSRFFILQLQKEYVGDDASIINIDINNNPQAAITHKVRSVPTLILFKNGKQLWRQSGIVPVNELERLIKENI
ncbi:thioredoxin family protein [Pedobacter cryotolerans]|uniref:Thioredoxin family protein n=1 Tax=Pedobacter cryotolerans TaxID=2571270 RepID=A0A4U1BVB2_9SPHI|nr:thioredoxin family protein [Pedobacter cryotolerans]TKB96418.1 thioredoxin family protein [Pedobacter cryotolerans]